MTIASIRRAARELALKMMFQVDVGRIPVADVLEHFELDEEIGEPPAAAIAYAHDLVRGAALHLPEIDRLLGGMTEEWAFDRLASVDRNILRLAVYESFYENEVPEEIVINEAVELAKEYSTVDSGKFVNGILGNLSRQRAAGADVRVPPAPEPPTPEPDPASDLPADGTEPQGGDSAKRPRRKRQPLRMDL